MLTKALGVHPTPLRTGRVKRTICHRYALNLLHVITKQQTIETDFD